MADLRIPEIRDGKEGMLRRRNRDRVLLGMRVIHLGEPGTTVCGMEGRR